MCSESSFMRLINSASDIQAAHQALAARLAAHSEWLCAEGDVELRAVPLRQEEWALEATGRNLIFSYWSECGPRTWIITGWDLAEEQIILQAARRTLAERALLKITPRREVRQEVESLAAARLDALAHLVEVVRLRFANFAVERASLSTGIHPGIPGRYARLLLYHAKEKTRVAATGEVNFAGARDCGAFLSSALLWFDRLRSASRPAHRLLLIAAIDDVAETTRLIALLRPDLRRLIDIYQPHATNRHQLVGVAQHTRDEYYATPARVRLHAPQPSPGSASLAERIVALAPEAIDVQWAGHGATLHFRGLAFARVRRVLGDERAWFGLNRRRRQLLNDESWPELLELVEQLRIHRRAGATDGHHAFYRTAPEAWLESILRRDITQLDPGLISSPLHAQFRAARGKSTRQIDLFALRHDGRLVLVELKVTADRQLPLQGADYWLRVEALRRQGALARARLFGPAARISDAPPLVYLAAPLLSFHRSFWRLAAMIDPAIELYRYDLNEDWRSGVRVARRVRVTSDR